MSQQANSLQSSLILLRWPNSLGSPDHPARKRARPVEPPHTKTQAVPPETQYTPPRLHCQGFETEMTAALELSNDLAAGKLNTYFNATVFTCGLQICLNLTQPICMPVPGRLDFASHRTVQLTPRVLLN